MSGLTGVMVRLLDCLNGLISRNVKGDGLDYIDFFFAALVEFPIITQSFLARKISNLTTARP